MVGDKTMENVIEYLEVGIVEYCNLNCKGCSHFSPLAGKTEYISVNEYEQDLKQLSHLLPIIYKIRLLGGEPLLHPDLNEIIRITRRYYPLTEIHVVTNGLLLLSKEKDFKIWADNNICVDISLYPPTELIKNNIEKVLVCYKIKYEFTKRITEFRKRMDLSGSNNIEESYRKCEVGNNCKYLYKGKLSGCPAPNVVRLFEKSFNYSLSCTEDMINIHTTHLSTNEIVIKLNSPLQMCKYCSKPENFEWKNNVGEYKEEDWIVRNEEKI